MTYLIVFQCLDRDARPNNIQSVHLQPEFCGAQRQVHELDIVLCHAPDEIVDRIGDGLHASAEGVYLYTNSKLDEKHQGLVIM